MDSIISVIQAYSFAIFCILAKVYDELFSLNYGAYVLNLGMKEESEEARGDARSYSP